MNSKSLCKLVVNSLNDLKGQSISCLHVNKITSITDYMVIVTGTSNRHLKALAEEVSDKVKQAGSPVLGVEGQDQAEWVLLDLGDVLVHIMLAATRSYYDLESLWGVEGSETGTTISLEN